MSSILLPTWKTTEFLGTAIVAGMATSKIRTGARLHYYIKEHIKAKGLTGDQVAARMGVASRSTVWKLDKEQHRLSPAKVLQIADALQMHPNELLYPPGVPSLDAAAADATPEQRELAVSLIKTVMGRR